MSIDELSTAISVIDSGIVRCFCRSCLRTKGMLQIDGWLRFSNTTRSNAAKKKLSQSCAIYGLFYGPRCPTVFSNSHRTFFFEIFASSKNCRAAEKFSDEQTKEPNRKSHYQLLPGSVISHYRRQITQITLLNLKSD